MNTYIIKDGKYIKVDKSYFKKKNNKPLVKKSNIHKPIKKVNLKSFDENINIEPSFAEQRIIDVLELNNIKFKREVCFRGFSKRFDFYFPEFQLIIEYDGSTHDNPEAQEIDKYKDLFCKINGLRMQRYNKKHWNDLESRIIKLIKKRKEVLEKRYKKEGIYITLPKPRKSKPNSKSKHKKPVPRHKEKLGMLTGPESKRNIIPSENITSP